jgi:hypothetical protein
MYHVRRLFLRNLGKFGQTIGGGLRCELPVLMFENPEVSHSRPMLNPS